SRTTGTNSSSPTLSSTAMVRALVITTESCQSLESDRERVEIRAGLAAVVRDSVDEARVGRAVAVGLGDVGRLEAAFGDQALRRAPDLGLVDRADGRVVPGVGLRLRDLTPAPHLSQEPDSVAVVRVSREMPEEHVEVGQRPAIASLELERAGHAVREHRGVRA